jgi:hypothetical protein
MDKNRYDNLVKSYKDLEKRFEDAKVKIAILEAEKNQWDQAKVMQLDIIQKTIDNKNAEMQRLSQEVQELKIRLRKYEGE